MLHGALLPTFDAESAASASARFASSHCRYRGSRTRSRTRKPRSDRETAPTVRHRETCAGPAPCHSLRMYDSSEACPSTSPTSSAAPHRRALWDQCGCAAAKQSARCAAQHRSRVLQHLELSRRRWLACHILLDGRVTTCCVAHSVDMMKPTIDRLS